jgi:1-acyl-sn-glycerol-3-phosphate acyltransferase
MHILGYFFLMLRTLACYFFAGIILLVTLPLLFSLLLVPANNNRFIFFLLDLFYKAIVGVLLVPITVAGKEHIPKEPAIIVANHQSALDIPIVGSLLNCHPHVWYALAYYAKIPVLGFFVRRLGIPISTDNGATAARALMQGVKFAKMEKSHIVIFPEGGRYIDGNVHAFSKGFALIARSSGRPVVPIYMPYNGKIYPPMAFWVRWHPLVIRIGPSFVYQENDTDEIFVDRVYTWFVQENEKYYH